MSTETQCTVCSGPIEKAPGEFPGTCGAPVCRWGRLDESLATAATGETGSPRRSVSALEERDRAAERWGIEDGGDYAPSLVHAMPLAVVPLAPKRTANFRSHIEGLVRQAGKAADEEPPRHEPEADEAGCADVSALARCACTLCAGACCRGGGDGAFFSTADIPRLRQQDSGRGIDDILDTYSAYLPSHVMQGSCVFHTIRGCALPREMRAATCGRFECDGLRHLLAGYRNRGQRRFCLFARRPFAPPRILFVEVEEEGVVLPSAPEQPRV